jgi:hypothetical protein
MAAVSPLTISVICSGPGASAGLSSKTKYSIIKLTAGNFTAQSGLVATLAGAYANLTDGNVSGYGIVVPTPGNDTIPTNSSNRGSKYVVTSQNPSGRNYTHTIPGAPGAGEFVGTTTSADLTGTNWAAYKDAFEAVATDPFGDNLTLTAAKLGGRRR